MTQSLETAVVPAASPARRGVFRKVLKSPIGIVSLAVLVVIVLITVLAPVLAPHDPNASSLKEIFAPISANHPLGGDSAGRDLLSRLMFGARTSLLGACLALLMSLVIGVPVGLIAGYYGKAFDSVASWTSNLVMALPAIIVLLALRSVAGSSIWVSMLVFGFILSPGVYRLVRSSVSGVRNELYVDAARVSGLSDATIIGRHILTVVRGPVIIQGAMILAISINIQAGLEFLGFGDADTASWGSMLNEGFLNIFRAPQMLLWPGLSLGITTAALALFASSLRDALQGGDPAPSRKRDVAGPAVANAESVDAAVAVAVTDALVDIDGLRVGYRSASGQATEVVHGVSLRIRRGEVLGLVGESGSGKTQVALSLLGLLPDGGAVESGSITFDGKLTTGRDKRVIRAMRGNRIGYIPQEPMSNLDPSFRIGSQLSETIRVHLGLSRSDARKRVIELLERVGIPDPERTYRAFPHEVSGGMAQRVLIAGAVSCDPEFLIADEPTTALDVTVQAEILDLLRGLQKEKGLAILLVTHNFGVVADLCDRVVVMRHGEFVETGEVEAIFASPQHPYTQALLGSTFEGGPAREPYVAKAEVSLS